jgi:hypothetical protein
MGNCYDVSCEAEAVLVPILRELRSDDEVLRLEEWDPWKDPARAVPQEHPIEVRARGLLTIVEFENWFNEDGRLELVTREPLIIFVMFMCLGTQNCRGRLRIPGKLRRS